MSKNKEDIWPDELDALVAAPENHKLLFENEFMRVLDTNVEPGTATPVHTHKYPASLYILSWSSFIRYDEEGNVTADSVKLGFNPEIPSVVWTEALGPHSLKNTGDKSIHVISFEIKK